MKQQKGFTYIEVIIAMVILSSVVMPISMAFVSATKNREQAQHIYEVTQHGENLLQEIQNQIDKVGVEHIVDIANHNPNLHSLFLSPTASEVDKIDFYKEFDKKYAIDKAYSYEVAIWEINDTLIPGAELMEIPQASDRATSYKFNLKSALADLNKKSFKLNTDSKYKLDQFADDKNIEWEISKDMARVFVNTPYKGLYSTYEIGKDIGYYGRGYIEIKEDPSKKKTLKAIIKDTTVMSYKANGMKKELVKLSYADGVCTISNPSYSADLTGSVNLVVDATGVDLSNYPPYNLSFINESEDTITMKVLTQKTMPDSKETLIKENINFDKHLNISVSTGKVPSGGTPGNISVVEYTDTLREDKPYLIVMMIRDKQPRIGKQDEIIKKMITIHTMDKK